MAHWRLADESDREAIVAMCLALYAEDPSEQPMSAARISQTLRSFREEPTRGRAVVLEVDGVCVGYALLASFWSNELGGEICTIDELYVKPALRGNGYGTALVRSLSSAEGLWPRRPVALELETTPDNRRARSLYQRLGFTEKRNTTFRLFVAERR